MKRLFNYIASIALVAVLTNALLPATAAVFPVGSPGLVAASPSPTPVQGGTAVTGNCSQLAANGQISETGFIRTYICNADDRNAIVVVIENITSFVVGLSTVLFTIMIGIGMLQVIGAGANPESLKAGKKKITLALSSIGLFLVGRIVMDALGITGGRFLGVDVASGQFTWATFTAILDSVVQYILFFGGVLATVMIVVGGIKMITSAGNPQAIQAARKTITYAVVGLLGIILAGSARAILLSIIT